MKTVPHAARLFPAVVADITTRVATIDPARMGNMYEAPRCGTPVRVIADREPDEAFGFDAWFASQADDVRNIRYEHSPKWFTAPEYFWRMIWTQLWCNKWGVSWHAAESPGPFTSTACSQAVREGNKFVVMEGLS